MHQKKSEVQIGKESSGVSSDFNPAPPLLHQTHNFHSTPLLNLPRILIAQSHPQDNDLITPTPSSSTPKTTPHKRPLLTQANPNPNPNTASSSSNSISKSPTFSTSLNQYAFPPTLTSSKARIPPSSTRALGFNFLNRAVTKEAALSFFRRLQHLRRLRFHLRLILLLSLPFFYFLLSHPSHSFVLDFLSAFAFSAALLFSLNLALPRLPSICLFLSRSLPIKLSSTNHGSRSPLPVFWSIGSRPKPDQKTNSGCWVEVYGNGDVYEGEFHNGKCSGCGIYYYYMSGRYEGDWIDGKYDGFGVETWARGSRYRGQYSKGLRHGFGVYRFYTGDVYAGEWSHGQSHGCGVHTCEDGSRYVGEFKWGVKHGLGHYHFRNGDVYAGEYFADRMHGFGVYRFENGHRYEGAWHEGKRQGLGMYTFRNGETQSGHWNNGILDVPSTQNNSYPVSPVGVYHSKVLNAVQGARRSAEKAYDVAKVDERVNRAVATANRSANAGRVAAVKAVQTQMHYSGKNDDNIPTTTM